MKYFLVILVLCFNILHAKDNSVEDSWKKTILFSKENKIFMLNTTSFDLRDIEIQGKVEYIQKNNRHLYVAVIFRDTAKNRVLMIYDVKNNKFINVGNISDIYQVFSDDGEYVVIQKESEIVVSRISTFDNKLIKKSDDKKIVIKGNPFGGIFPVSWEGDLLLYYTGTGEKMAFGVLNAAENKNYFLTACGFFKNTSPEFKQNCNGLQNNVEKLKDKFFEKIKNGKVVLVSYDFYNFVREKIKTK